MWGGLAGKGAEFVCTRWHVLGLAELGASVVFGLSVDATSKDPPMSPTSFASVAGLCSHRETGGDVVGFEECAHSVRVGLGWVG